MGFGRRSIGTVGGISLLLNNCLGPGVAEVPGLFQQSGFFPCIICFLLFGGAALVSGWMLMYAQSRVPYNLPRTEFAGLCRFYFSHAGFVVSQIFFILTMIVLCVGGVLQTAQLMDFLLVRIFGQSCAIQLYPDPFSIACASSSTGFSVFPDGTYPISAGYAVAALVTVPFGFFPLEDNIKFQIFSCAVMMLCVVFWVIDFSLIGLEASRVPVVGSSFKGLIGCALFNYCVAFSLPSWNNERLEDISVLKSMATAIGIASIMMFLIGMFGGTAFTPYYFTTKNLMDQIDEANRPLSIAAMYLFSLANNITSIPVFSICIRYCLIEFDTVRPSLATALSVIVPWLLVLPFSTGKGFSTIITYGGMIFLSVTGFIIPPILFYLAVHNDRDIKLDGVTSPTKAFSRLQVEEHPSRSFSYIANLQFSLIYGKRAVYAKVAALCLCALLVACALLALVMQIFSDATN